MDNNYCVIMAGGAGTRFWPAGTVEKPKQFLDVLGTGQTLLQQTFNRMLPVCAPENFLVVTNQKYKNLVLEQLPELEESRVLTEPDMRNTAPCVAYAAFCIRALGGKSSKMIVTPADHLILKQSAFEQVLNTALTHVESSHDLVTMGIVPHRPDTGYGYIQFENSEGKNIFEVKRFTEKPKPEKAEEFVASGDFYWNSGMFVWQTEAIINEFKQYTPDIYNLFNLSASDYAKENRQENINRVYKQCPSISIDYAIMENSDSVKMVKADIGWSDLGTWGSVYEAGDKDENDNVNLNGNVLFEDAGGNFVKVPDGKVAAIQGLNNFIVVDTGKALLILNRDNGQQVKELRNSIEKRFGAGYI